MIAGVCGVGKSTITRELSKNLNLTWGDYADMMLEVMNETDKDKIQYLDWETKRAVYDQVENLIALRFSKENSDGRIHLLENHLTIIQDGKIVAFPTEDYRKYNLIGIISVSAPPRSILERRLKDPTRRRLADTIDLIAEQQRMNDIESSKITKYLGIPLMDVLNKDGRPPVLEVQKWTRDVIFGENRKHSPEKL